MAAIQVLLDSHPGPLPLKGQFTPMGNLVPSVFLSGTAQATGASTIVVQLQLYDQDGKDAGGTSAIVFSNEVKQHKTLLSLFVNQKPFNFGETYTYELFLGSPTTITDANDSYSLTILY